MKKFFIAIIACALGCMTANAQEYVEAPYGFVNVRGGAQSILLKKNAGDFTVSPTAAISLGSMFNPYVGARIDMQGVWNKVDLSGVKSEYKSLTADLDILLNLSNCLRDEKYAPFNLYVLGGAGVIGNWDEPNSATRETVNDWYNFRLGAIADYRLSRITSINLEVDGNYMNGSKSEIYGNGKWKIAAFLGLTFKFPYTESAFVPAATAAPVTSEADYAAAQAAAAKDAEAKAAAAKKAAEAEQARKAAAAAAKKAAETNALASTNAAQTKADAVAPIDDTIFFTIGRTDNAAKWNQVVKAAAAWCKKNPNKTITVAGYADKGTGTAEINAKVAEARATKVANAIKAKGVPADQIKVSSYGDTVQPFSDNDQNRCVIVSGK